MPSVSNGIGCDVCPISNVCLGVYPSVGAHPIRRLIEATHLQPTLIPAHYALRSAYNALGEKQKAAVELEQIKRIGQENAASDQSPFSVEDALFTVRPPL